MDGTLNKDVFFFSNKTNVILISIDKAEFSKMILQFIWKSRFPRKVNVILKRTEIVVLIDIKIS